MQLNKKALEGVEHIKARKSLLITELIRLGFSDLDITGNYDVSLWLRGNKPLDYILDEIL